HRRRASVLDCASPLALSNVCDNESPITNHESRAAFTLIEIAISLAVIGFALVAIIGILPSGMSVQKDNRNDTIIAQDASIFIDAIQNGEHGLDDLTNYVYAITNYAFGFGSTIDPTKQGNHVYAYTYTGSWRDGAATPTPFPIISGNRIIGLLSTPKYIDA